MSAYVLCVAGQSEDGLGEEVWIYASLDRSESPIDVGKIL